MRLALLFLALPLACEGGGASKPAEQPRAMPAIDMPSPPPLVVRDAGAEASAPVADNGKVGALSIIARSKGASFVVHRLGEDVIVRSGRSVAKLEGDELVPLPTFFDGIPAWDGILLAKDKAFDRVSPPAGERESWHGSRRVLAIAGTSVSDVWVVVERGNYQMWAGEVWRRSAANAPLKLVKDTGSSDRTFAAAAVAKPDVLYGIVHPYADNASANDRGPLYRFDVVGNGPRLSLGTTPKDCLAQVYPRGLLAFPTGEAMLYGRRCTHLDSTAAVARWDGRSANSTLDVLPAPGKTGAVTLDGALADDRDKVWVFGGATPPRPKDATEDPTPKAYLAQFDGKKWSRVEAPDSVPLTHLVKAANGSLAAFTWPTAFYVRDGANGRWAKNDLDPALSHVRASGVWLGRSDDLFVAGSYDKENIGVVLHTKPAKKIFETDDEYTGE